jgi:hypothetical protein
MKAEFKKPILSVVHEFIGYLCFVLASLIGIAQIIAASLLLAVGLALTPFIERFVNRTPHHSDCGDVV